MAALRFCAVPLADEPFGAAARQFVAEQTSACREQLLERVARSIDLDDPRIAVSERKGRLRVRADGVVVATLTRWEIVGPRIKRVGEDLLASDRPLPASTVSCPPERTRGRARDPGVDVRRGRSLAPHRAAGCPISR